MKLGDLVSWTNVKNHDYFDSKKVQLGIFLKELEIYDHWVLAEVVDSLGQRTVTMLQKRDNPI